MRGKFMKPVVCRASRKFIECLDGLLKKIDLWFLEFLRNSVKFFKSFLKTS